MSGGLKHSTTIKKNLLQEHANANTKSRMRMVTLYQIAGTVGGIVVGTGNKVEDYGVGFYTKYGDGGVDIAPIADLYKSEVWELGEYLGVDQRIVDAQPTDGLWGDSRTDESQLGASYPELEEAMETGTGPNVAVLEKFNTQNKHKMVSYPNIQIMKIGLIGAGRLGICLALLIEKAGYEVLASDNRVDYINSLQKGIIDTAEPEVQQYLSDAKNIEFTTDNLRVISECDLIFTLVATPSLADGSYDVSAV